MSDKANFQVEVVTCQDDIPENISKGIVNSHYDVAALPLEQCPFFSEEDDVCITAISKRLYTGEGILIKADSVLNSSIHALDSTKKIGLFSELQQKQAEILFPDCTFKKIATFEHNEHIDLWMTKLDGILVSGLYYEFVLKTKPDLGFLPLHPTEMIPSSGHGIIAYICHKEDIDTRKLLNTFHCKEMVPIANAERQVVKFQDQNKRKNIAVFCSADHRNNYHICGFNAENSKRIKFSQSISQGISKKMFDQLM